MLRCTNDWGGGLLGGPQVQQTSDFLWPRSPRQPFVAQFHIVLIMII